MAGAKRETGGHARNTETTVTMVRVPAKEVAAELAAYLLELKDRDPDALPLVSAVLAAETEVAVVEAVGNIGTSDLCVRVGTEVHRNEKFCSGDHARKMQSLAMRQDALLREEADRAGVGTVTIDRPPVGDGVLPVAEGGDGEDQHSDLISYKLGATCPPLPAALRDLGFTDDSIVNYRVEQRPVKLTNDEVLGLKDKMSELIDQIDNLETEKTNVAKVLKAKIDLANTELRNVNRTAKRGEVDRDVPVYDVWKAGGYVETYRVDTNEKVGSRPATEQERQTHLSYIGNR